MEWWIVLLLLFSSLAVLISIRMPVAFSFLLVNFVAAFYYFGGIAGLNQLILGVYSSVTTFSLVPVPLFVLLGEIIFHSGIGMVAIDTIGTWIGKIPGRLSVLTVGVSTMFAALSGSAMATTAMMGTIMVPEMRRRGYSKGLALGSILGSGGLAMIIPPSSFAVLLGSLAGISIAKLLIAGIIPGIVIAFCFITYIITRCFFNPSLAPMYELTRTTLFERVMLLVRNVLPLGLIFFAAVGVIFIGVATPEEAAAIAVLISIILAAFYGKLNLEVVKKSVFGTVRVTSMIFIIFTTAITFSQILAFSGATRGLIQIVTDLRLSPLVILMAMLMIVLILGCFIDQISIVMLCIPLFMPIIRTLGFDPVWFGILILICVEMGNITPPFGLTLFIMKGITPPDITMGDIYRSVVPFISVQLFAVGLIIVFPKLATWLPNLMR